MTLERGSIKGFELDPMVFLFSMTDGGENTQRVPGRDADGALRVNCSAEAADRIQPLLKSGGSIEI
jgi:hypothetical protein